MKYERTYENMKLRVMNMETILQRKNEKHD